MSLEALDRFEAPIDAHGMAGCKAFLMFTNGLQLPF